MNTQNTQMKNGLKTNPDYDCIVIVLVTQPNIAENCDRNKCALLQSDKTM